MLGEENTFALAEIHKLAKQLDVERVSDRVLTIFVTKLIKEALALTTFAKRKSLKAEGDKSEIKFKSK